MFGYKVCLFHNDKDGNKSHLKIMGNFNIHEIHFFFWPIYCRFVSWMEWINLIDKFFQRLFTMLPNKKYIINIPPPNIRFLFNFF